MIDHVDLVEFLDAVSALKNKNLRPPTTKDLADALFMSRGAIEYRVKLLQEAGVLVKPSERSAGNFIILEGEMYMPPPWMQASDGAKKQFLYRMLSEKRQRNSRQHKGELNG